MTPQVDDFPEEKNPSFCGPEMWLSGRIDDCKKELFFDELRVGPVTTLWTR